MTAMRSRTFGVLLVVLFAPGAALPAQEGVFSDGFESGDFCSWSSFLGECSTDTTLEQSIEARPDAGICLGPLDFGSGMTACTQSTCVGGGAGCQLWLSVGDATLDLLGSTAWADYVVPSATVDLHWDILPPLPSYNCNAQLSVDLYAFIELDISQICGSQTQRIDGISVVGVDTTCDWSECGNVPPYLLNALLPQVEGALDVLVADQISAEIDDALVGVWICPP